jgi:hypothetical protein
MPVYRQVEVMVKGLVLHRHSALVPFSVSLPLCLTPAWQQTGQTGQSGLSLYPLYLIDMTVFVDYIIPALLFTIP